MCISLHRCPSTTISQIPPLLCQCLPTSTFRLSNPSPLPACQHHLSNYKVTFLYTNIPHVDGDLCTGTVPQLMSSALPTLHSFPCPIHRFYLTWKHFHSISIITSRLTPKWRAPTLAWSLFSPPAAVFYTSHGHVQCLTWIPLTRTVLLVDSGKLFEPKDKIAIF